MEHEKAQSEKSEETISRVLSTYDLGNKLRMLRLRKKISLVDLGKHTGLSASMLSQLENGKLVPTLPTLARIAMVFDVGLDYFFADKRRKKLFSIVRAGERMRFPDRADNPSPNFFFEVLAFSAQDKGLQAYLAEFPVRENEPAEHYHDGAEFLLVLEGELAITFQHEEHVLKTGDSVYFDSSEPHAYAARQAAKAVVITTPPRI
ncbi:MAG: helix-turn-helix transcriptional regulator [Bryobacterales bacterium]|nr:helix-turn-helix transcriptional regulator [Bryobacterales bacterium]